MKSAAFFSTLLPVAFSNIIGVAPHEQHLYVPKISENGDKLWACLSDPSIILSYDQINDDFCDCPDGSDEPGTNACPVNASKPFYCENKGHFPAYIDNFKLNDGACDYDVCCDGSDEYLTHQCPDKCEQIHKQYVSYVEDHNKAVEKSSKIQKQLIASAENYVQQMLDHVNNLKADFDVKNQELDQLKLKLEEENQKAEGKTLTVYDHLSKSIDSIQRLFSSFLAREKKNSGSIRHLEDILDDLITNYNPNFNDAAVKSAVNKFQDYISNKEPAKDEQLSPEVLIQQLSETAKLLTAEPVREFVVPNIANMVHYYYQRLFDYFYLEADSPRSPPGVTPPSNEIIASIEKDVDATTKAIQNIQTEVDIFEEDLKTNYGPKNMLRALRKVVVDKKIGEYDYKINILDGVYQDQTVVGRFSHYEDGKLYYLEGQKCWNGPRRKAVVQLVCGSSHEIISAAELERCEYYLELTSPIACTPISDADLKKNFRINYELL